MNLDGAGCTRQIVIGHFRVGQSLSCSPSKQMSTLVDKDRLKRFYNKLTFASKVMKPIGYDRL